MKKITILFTIAATISSFVAQAQPVTPFFEKVSYQGALSADVSKDWTTGWTNWDPKNAVYPTPTETTTLNAASTGKIELTGTVTLDASKVYLLTGFIVVKSGADLIIPAGTIIRCQGDVNATPANYSSIIVERGGQIHINGTAVAPVIFTSNKAVGSRDRGNWGGIVLCGKSPNNQGGDVQVEGFNNVAFDAGLAKYGGTDESDNSGSITYCRIEFGGLAFEVNKEINGLTFGSVGNNTLIDNVQVSFSNDDSYEWFGGSVRCKHLIAYKGTDDDFDTDYGYHGAVQFGIGARDSAYFDGTWAAPSGSSTSEGFESDNDANGSGKTPLTNAVFSNMTMIGPIPMGSNYNKLSSTAKNAFRRGARIRRNSRISVINTIFMGYRNMLMYDGDSCLILSGAKGNTYPAEMLFRNNLIVNSDSGYKSSSPWKISGDGLVEVALKDSNSLAGFNTWVKSVTNGNKVNPVAFTAGTVLIDPSNTTAPNFRPVATSPALTGTNFSYNRLVEYGTFDPTSSVSNKSLTTQISIFPNPASDQVYINLYAPASLNGVITLTDASGKVAYSNSIKVNNGQTGIQIPLNNITNGLYIIRIATANGSVSGKVLVNH